MEKTAIVGKLVSSFELTSELFDINECLGLILEGYKVPSELAPHFHMSERRLMTELNKIFHGIKLPKQPWKVFLLDLINLKFCKKCNKIRCNTDFHNYKDTKYSYCVDCEKERVLEHEEAERRKISCRNRYYNNPGPYKARAALRRALICKATPAWASTEAINLIYEQCPEGYEVDHIVPLQGELVCGLHVENNLQYLTKEANRSKYNKFSS